MIWVLIEEVVIYDSESAIRICGTTLDDKTAQLWAGSREGRNALSVPLDGLAEGEVL